MGIKSDRKCGGDKKKNKNLLPSLLQSECLCASQIHMLKS